MSQSNFSNKTSAREYAFKFIYRLFLENFATEKDILLGNKVDFETAIIEFEESYVKEDEEHLENELNPSIQAHGQKLIKGFLDHSNEITKAIEPNLSKRNLNSVGQIEKAVLCLGVYEILFEETPKKVALNEYINLVKKYGSKESSAFVNGVLDKVNKR